MVILLSALAVVVAVILLVAGFVLQGGFTLIYAAMGFAVLSMLLLTAARWIGSAPDQAGSDAPDPLPVPATGEARADAVGEVVLREPPVQADEGAGLPIFPIADYDSLWVSQIVPLVAELDRDELDVVDARERGGRHRAAVLDAIARNRSSALVAVASPNPTSEPEPDLDLSVELVRATLTLPPEPERPAPRPPAAEPEEPSASDDDSPMVRTFLGRRRSPVTVQRG